MSYIYYAQKDRPIALFSLDRTAPFVDFSGYGKVGKLKSGSVANTTAVPLTSCALFSSVFASTSVAQFFPGVFLTGRESREWSLEAWVMPIGDNIGDVAVLSHTGIFDGIVLNDNSVSFVLKFATAPEARITHTFDIAQKMHIVAIRTLYRITLYVNGELIDSLDLTDDQIADAYAASTTDLVSGETATATQIAMNGVAMYGYPLTPDIIAAHYEAGNIVVDPHEIYGLLDGAAVEAFKYNAHVFLDEVWETEDDFSDGIITNVTLMNDQITPLMDDDGLTMAGTWMTTFPLDYDNPDFTQDADPIFAVYMDWDGDGMTIDASLDSINWTPVDRLVNTPLVPSGFDPTNKDLFVRVSFAAGMDGTQYLNSLEVVGFKDGVIDTDIGRTVTVDNSAIISPKTDLFLYCGANGVTLKSGGAFTIEGGDPVRTIGVWLYRQTNAVTFNVSGTVYRNGSTVGTALPTNQWSLRHIVLAADWTNDITISGNGTQVGLVVLYPTALSASDILRAWKAFTGRPVVTINPDTSVLGISDALDPQIFAYDWSIMAGG